MGQIDARLAALGLAVPEAAAPVANYVPFVIANGIVHISGQISKDGDRLITGKLGQEHAIAAGQAAARVCAINLIAQMKAAAGGDLERVAQVIKLGGFVNATPDFVDIPQVINGASDLMVEVFGDAGRHARSAVACPTLPLGVSVEIDAVVALKD